LEKHLNAHIDSFSTSQIQPIRCLQGGATVFELVPLQIGVIHATPLILPAIPALEIKREKNR
jgi:hypothetical protein